MLTAPNGPSAGARRPGTLNDTPSQGAVRQPALRAPSGPTGRDRLRRSSKQPYGVEEHIYRSDNIMSWTDRPPLNSKHDEERLKLAASGLQAAALDEL